MSPLAPQQPKVTALVIAAHPDDETICAGGAMALLSRRGVQVIVASSTRGEGGVAGDPPLCLPDEVGQRREAELRRAAALLGARSVLFLGYVDPPVAAGNVLLPATTDVGEYAGRVLTLLHAVSPDLVITHGTDGEYGHPQHVITHRAVMAAWEAWQRDAGGKPDAALYTFAAACPPAEAFSSFRNPSDAATTVVEISAVRALKTRAFRAHATQVATTLKDAGLRSARGMFPPTECFHRWAGPSLLERLLKPGANEPFGAKLLTQAATGSPPQDNAALR